MKKDTSKGTVLVISMGFLVLYLLFSWTWAIWVALATGVTGALSGHAARLIETGWMKLGHLLGLIIPNILLGAVFYLVLLPVALLSRISGKDPLRLSSRYDSYFFDVNREYDRKGFEKTW